jgi:hypothetical protein
MQYSCRKLNAYIKFKEHFGLWQNRQRKHNYCVCGNYPSSCHIYLKTQRFGDWTSLCRPVVLLSCAQSTELVQISGSEARLHLYTETEFDLRNVVL